MAESVSSNRNTSYYTYFSKVLAKRLKYLRNITILIAFFVAILLKFPYDGIWWNILTAFTIRGPILFLALYLVKLSRDRNSPVDFSEHSVLAMRIYHTVLTKKFALNTLFYLVSSGIIFTTFIFQLSLRSNFYLESTEFQKKPVINDEWVYYWFHCGYLGVLYCSQFLILQKNRLPFKYGVSKVKPEDVLLKKVPIIISNTVRLSLFVTITSPIFYLISRSFIYRFNWLIILILGLDTNVPKFHVSFKTILNLSYLTTHIIFSWEAVNYVYNVYSTIGCLDGKTLISTYSSDPINTLLSGLRDIDPDHQLSRLTAFQELACIATTKDPEGIKWRRAMFNARFRNGFIWPAILDECSLVIKETTSRINYRSSSDLAALKKAKSQFRDPVNIELKGTSNIFGNSTIDKDFDKKANKSNIPQYDEVYSSKAEPSFKNNEFYKKFESRAGKILTDNFGTVFPTKLANSSVFKSLEKNVQDLKTLYDSYHNLFLSTSIGIFFRVTLKSDTEARVLNAVNFGNAVLAVSNLLIHSTEEDKNFTITNNHISEVLNLLEKPIRATSNYTDYLPASVYQSPSTRNYKNHLVALIHDLTMNEFFQLCIKFNYKLNDLVLNARTYKLAKWVIDVAIAQQQKGHKSTFNNNLKR